MPPFRPIRSRFRFWRDAQSVRFRRMPVAPRQPRAMDTADGDVRIRLRVDEGKPLEGARRLLAQIRPHWRAEGVAFKVRADRKRNGHVRILTCTGRSIFDAMAANRNLLLNSFEIFFGRLSKSMFFFVIVFFCRRVAFESVAQILARH